MAFFINILAFLKTLSSGFGRRFFVSIGALCTVSVCFLASLQLNSLQQTIISCVFERVLNISPECIAYTPINGLFPFSGNIDFIRLNTPLVKLEIEKLQWHFSLRHLAFDFTSIDTMGVHIQASENSTITNAYGAAAAIINQQLFRSIVIKHLDYNGQTGVSLRLETDANAGQRLQLGLENDVLDCHIFCEKQQIKLNFQAKSPTNGVIAKYVATHAGTAPDPISATGSINANLDKEMPHIWGALRLTHDTFGILKFKGTLENNNLFTQISITQDNTTPLFNAKATLVLAKEITLNTLDGNILERNFSLESPVILDTHNRTLSPIRLRIGQTQLDLKNIKTPSATQPWQGAIQFQGPLTDLGSDIPEGIILGNITLSGMTPLPHVQATAEIKDLPGKLKPFRLTFKGDFENETLKTTVTSYHDHQTLMALDGQISNLFQSPTLALKTRGNINLSFLGAFLGKGDKIRGIMRPQLTIGGKITEPQLAGTIHVDDGYYENAFSGTLLNHLHLDLKAKGKILTIENLTFEDGQKEPGRVLGHGKITFDGFTPQFNIRLNLTKFKVAHNDGIEGHATGFLSLEGIGKDAKIKGEASLDRLVLSLEELVTVEVPTLLPESYEKSVSPPAPPPYLLMDVLLKAQKIYINGFGINSVWHGEVQVINPVFSPDLLGTIMLKRGSIEILGKPMGLKKGTITYDLEKLSDPVLKIRATKEQGGEKISLKIEGRASSPQFIFTSSPPLPEEEVLSRILFGKEISAISPSQSLQLAATAASMNGQSGLNVMDTFRKSLHFDSLEIKDNKRLNTTSGEEQTTQALSVGKEFGAVKVSIDQGVSTGSKSKATVEMEVSKNLTLEGDVGGDRSSGVGITWVKRY